MKVLESIEKTIKKRRMHFTLVDPDKQSSVEAGEIAAAVESVGSDAIMVGGSTGVDFSKVDQTVAEIKARCKLPVILFPGSAKGLTPKADAIFFMSMLNSRKREFLIGQQVRGARVVKMMRIEPIPMAYVVVAPGMRVGEIGDAQLVERDDFEGAISYALAAQYMGMRLLYLEAGSGAPEPVPAKLVSAVKKEAEIPLIVGGGIRTAEAARDILDAGANIVVTGTLVERTGDVARAVGEITKIVRSFKNA